MSLYKGTHLIAGNDSVGIEKIIDQKLRERDEKRYYIGSIIIDTKNINPSDYLGFGTWEYFGEGKCLVGVDAGQTEFNTVEKTGGEKQHSLTRGELPRITGQINFHGSGAGGTVVNGTSGDFISNGIQNKYIGGSPIAGAQSVGLVSMDFGGNGSHNNLQPYITVYIWKRIS